MNTLERLRVAQSIEDLSKLLDVDKVGDEELLDLILFSTSSNYVTWHIPKKRGGVRRISSPKPRLMSIQTSIARLLTDLYEPSDNTHGFLKERNIVTNALPHVGKRWVFNIDLKDFFPTIKAHRIYGLFTKPPYSLNFNIAEALTHLCTFQGELPAGAPTSPVISNMICRTMDRQLYELARRNNCYYTRYADDLTFSASQQSFPMEIAVRDGSSWGTGPTLSKVISRAGFTINSSKVRMQERSVQQSVTGVVVNSKANIDRRYIRNIRGAINALQKYGPLAQTEFEHRISSDSPSTVALSAVIEGRIAFVSMVRGKDDPLVQKLRGQLRAALRRELPGTELTSGFPLSDAVGSSEGSS